MSSRLASCVLMFFCAVVPACKDEIPPPPPEEPTPAERERESVKPIEIDAKRSVTFKADRTITIPNLVCVIQSDAGNSESFGFTLVSSKPSADGSRLVFGSIETAKNIDALVNQEMHFASGAVLESGGNGVFTSTASYQPKFVTVKLTAINGNEVEGTIAGDFYRFSRSAPKSKPTALSFSGKFIASLVRK